MLSETEKMKKTTLLKKMRTRNLTYSEATELRSLLEREKAQAASLGDILAVILIGLLIGAVIAFIGEIVSE